MNIIPVLYIQGRTNLFPTLHWKLEDHTFNYIIAVLYVYYNVPYISDSKSDISMNAIHSSFYEHLTDRKLDSLDFTNNVFYYSISQRNEAEWF